MGYHTQTGRFADDEEITLNALQGTTLSTDGYSRVLELGDRAVANLTLAVASVSSGDTLDVTIQCSRDGVNGWYSVGTFTQVTEAGTERKAFLLDRFVRAHFNVTGSDVAIVATLTGRAA